MRGRRALRATLAAGAVALGLAVPAIARGAGNEGSGAVCGVPSPGYAACLAELPSGRGATPDSATPQVTPSGLSPAAIDAVYGFSSSSSGGSGQTVAVVDAYDDADAAADLNAFSAQFGLPQCDTSNPCFSKVNQSGGSSYPAANASWDLEISLDIEWIHAVAPAAHILLVEADSDSLANLVSAEQYAAAHASYVSNSWGSPEFSGEKSLDADFDSPGVSYFAASGDTAAEVDYPAASPQVIAVGGTSLAFTSAGTLKSETAWSDGGGGCSAYETASSAQAGFAGYANAGCAGMRAVPDVSIDGDPDSGLAVYDSTPYEGSSGWWTVGGTSASTALWAGEAAVFGSPISAQTIYGTDAIPFRDIVAGGNGHPAGPGYDLATGLGSWAYTPGPAALSASGESGAISLAWTAPTGAPATQYQVLRGTSPGAESLTPIATTSATSYEDTAVTPGTTYSYVVVAVDGAGSGPFSNEASAAVAKIATATALASSANPSNVGELVTFTATIAPAPDGGTVLFEDGGATISGCGAVAPAAGVASCTTSETSPGTHTISASYGGDPSYAGSTSGALLQSVEGTSEPVTEFTVPLAGAEPTGIASGPDGNLWFTEQLGDEIGRISPSGQVTEFPLGAAGVDGTLPESIAAGPDGSLWFAQSNASEIGRITSSGTISEFPVPGGDPNGIAAGPDGNLWFTGGPDNSIGRITPSGTITEFPLPTPDAGASSIAAGPDGNLWFTEQAADQIGRITPSGTITEFSLPHPDSQPFGIAAGPDGNVWFTEGGSDDPALEQIGRITPSGTITEFPLPAGAGPSPAIAPGPDGDLWFTEDGDDGIGQITPTGTITSYSIPTPSSEPWGIAAGPDGNVWFTEMAADRIGRIATGAPTASQQPPAISGSGVVGQPVSCEPAVWSTWASQQPSPSALGFDGYQWLLDGVPVQGQTGQTYTPSSIDAGRQLSCTETVTYSLLSVTVSATSAPLALVPAAGTILAAGQSLAEGQSLLAGVYRLTMQGDGNLVEYDEGGDVVWAAGTNPAGSFVAMQGDGNLVVYDGDGDALWASGTSGNPGAYLLLADTGELELVSPAGDALWAAGGLGVDGVLAEGQSLLSGNGVYRLTMQGDGNLVEYDEGGDVVWAAGTNPAGSFVAMQGDGNLVVYDGDGDALWASGTSGNPGAYLLLADTGELELVSPAGDALWAAGGLGVDGVLAEGQSLFSGNGVYRLTMQGDGNLVEYDEGGDVVWAAGTNPAGSFVAMQGDGNLVVYDGDGDALWASGTSGNPGAYLLLADTGELELVSPAGDALWSNGAAAGAAIASPEGAGHGPVGADGGARQPAARLLGLGSVGSAGGATAGREKGQGRAAVLAAAAAVRALVARLGG